MLHDFHLRFFWLQLGVNLVTAHIVASGQVGINQIKHGASIMITVTRLSSSYLSRSLARGSEKLVRMLVEPSSPTILMYIIQRKRINTLSSSGCASKVQSGLSAEVRTAGSDLGKPEDFEQRRCQSRQLMWALPHLAVLETTFCHPSTWLPFPNRQPTEPPQQHS